MPTSFRPEVTRLALAALVALGVAACGGSPAPAASAPPSGSSDAGAERVAPGVRFLKRAPRVGTRIEDTSEMSVRISMRVTAGGSVVAEPRGHQQKSERRRIEVLEATDTDVRKVRVEYVERTEREEDEAGPRSTRSPLVGRTYVVERRGDVIVATDAAGKMVEGAELEELRQEHQNLGRTTRFSSFIPDRPVEVGERLVPPPEVAAEMFGDGGRDVVVRSAAFTFAGAPRPALGEFYVDLSLQLGGEPPMDLRLRGKLTVRVQDSLPVAMRLSGPISIDGTSPKTGATFSGNGQMELVRTAEYR